MYTAVVSLVIPFSETSSLVLGPYIAVWDIAFSALTRGFVRINVCVLKAYAYLRSHPPYRIINLTHY